MRAGFIGLGSQGAPMARRIVDAGLPLTIWARRAASTVPFADSPATVAATPAEVGARSDWVGICVVADDDVEQVLLGEDGVLAGLAPGGLVAIHSTIHPATARRLAGECERQGAALVDAPVSGGSPAASAGRLLVMAGGREDEIERCRPVFETFSDRIVPVGGVGDAQVVKLINNFAFTAQLSLALETLEFADRLGVDRGSLCETLAQGSGGSRAIDILNRNGFTLSGIARSRDVLRKDVRLARQLAGEIPDAEPETISKLSERIFERLDRE